MKKICLAFLISLTSFATKAQIVKDQIFKVDTVPGHGYEVMFIGNKITKKVYIKTDSGVKSIDKDFYRPGDYTWDHAKEIIDSVNNIDANWVLPSTKQLKIRHLYTNLTINL